MGVSVEHYLLVLLSMCCVGDCVGELRCLHSREISLASSFVICEYWVEHAEYSFGMR